MVPAPPSNSYLIDYVNVISPQDIGIAVNKGAHGLLMHGNWKEARQWDTNMKLISDYNAANKCDGGHSNTSLSQVQFVLDGCPVVRYAFAGVPGAAQNVCWRCFFIEFM